MLINGTESYNMTTQPHKLAKVTGPPGTGKTTYLLNLIEKAAKKYEPEKIGAVSLTNAAIEEMRDRVKKQTGLSRSAAKNIRTIHSTCFRLLNLKKEQVADKNIKEFNEAYPEWRMPLDVEVTEDDAFDAPVENYTPGQNKRCFAEIQMYRHQLIPFEEWPDERSKAMFTDWKHWMRENNYIDFTGMLEDTLMQGLAPNIEVLMVDEAQDMSKLSVELLELWGEDTTSTVYVGDSDQAILRFAGAVPEAFMNLEHTWTKVLGQSYRVPKKVHEYAMRIIGQVKTREPVEYKPTGVEGSVITCNEPDLTLEGTHMILGRCNYHLNRWRHYLMNRNIPWHNPYRPGDLNYNPVGTKIWRAARNYVKLCRGIEIKEKDLRQMVKNMIVDGNLLRGMKSKISEMDFEDTLDMFGIISSGLFTDSFLTFEKNIEEVFNLTGQSGEMLKNTDDILVDPKIIIGTFHSLGYIVLRTPFDAFSYEQFTDRGTYLDEYTVLREMSINFGRAIMGLCLIVLIGLVGLKVAFPIAAMASLLINVF